jgi:hypothetical protein
MRGKAKMLLPKNFIWYSTRRMAKIAKISVSNLYFLFNSYDDFPKPKIYLSFGLMPTLLWPCDPVLTWIENKLVMDPEF